MRYMGRVIDSEANGNDYVHDDHGVERQIPIVDQCKQEQIDQKNCQYDQNRHRQTTSNHQNDYKDGDYRQADTKKCLIDEDEIQFVVEEFLRIREGPWKTICVFYVADVIQVLGALFRNFVNLLRPDSHSVANNFSVIIEDDIRLILSALVRLKELFKAWVKLIFGNKLSINITGLSA